MSDRQQRRTERILKLLLHKGSVSVAELIASLHTSAPSIRRDLTLLEAQGLIRRTHGGAALVQELLYEPFRYDAAFQTRQHPFVREKRHIGVAAAELIEENETIGLTAGTTTTWVARSLRHRNNLTVVTNAVNIGMELCNMPGLKIHLTGGYVRWPWSEPPPSISLATFFSTSCFSASPESMPSVEQPLTSRTKRSRFAPW